MKNRTIIDNLKSIKQEIENGSDSIRLVAVSKKAADMDIELLYNAGQLAFAESYITEFQDKVTQLRHLKNIEWHFIGALQSNKLKYLVNKANWIHSLEKGHHAIKLNQLLQESKISRKSMLYQEDQYITAQSINILIEVNISNEPNRHGLKTIEEVIALAQVIAQQNNLLLRGIMGIASNTQDTNIQTAQFTTLSNMFNYLKQHGFPNIDTLSMGMSNDYITAIKCGATMVRIGSKIFGIHK
jgi:pyridoxal phosphate enzyme (YggS family)